jgi:LysR family transcriptional activator of nhaA
MTMTRLNYKHLRYFWMVAKTGSIARASERLHLTPQSISGQLSEFEESLGVELFRKAGRGIELTDTGREALRYADDIFALGDDLMQALHDQPRRAMTHYRIGIADSVPKHIAYRLVAPALTLADPIRLICREGRLDSLLGELAVHRLDLVIADRPMPSTLNVRGYSHLLGECGITVFGADSLRKSLGAESFPALIDGAPFLMPGEDVSFRPRLLQWFDEHKLRPRVIGEFDDNALAQAFGQAGAGLFVAPSAATEQILAVGGISALGTIPDISEQLYAITTERRLVHPATIAIRDTAHGSVFRTTESSASIPAAKSKARRVKASK